jgi:Cellulase (glycosyl hydrolase family 5)
MRRRLTFFFHHSRACVGALTTVLILLILPLRPVAAGSVRTLDPVTNADGRLGLADVLPGTTPGKPGVPWAQLAFEAGARTNRWEFRWDKIEAEPALFDFTDLDAAVGASRQHGLDVLGILIGTPAWATAAGQRPGNGRPRGLNLPFDDPNNLWAEYVRETVSRYQGQVKYWEVWNEPDTSFFWSSSPEVYYQLLKVSYQTIKSVDPNALVVMAGMVAPDFGFVKRVLAAGETDPAGPAHHGFFDVVAWHVYGPAVSAYSNVSAFRQILNHASYPDTPIWVTETGFPASNPNGESRQAAYVLQTAAYSLAAGADKVMVYRTSDDTTNKTWGLISAQGSPRMGYVAFQVAARYFGHTTAVAYAPDGISERFTFYQSDQRLTVMWNRGLSDHEVRVVSSQPAAPGESVDWLGVSTLMNNIGGQYSLTLPGATYNAGIDPTGSVVGGPPVIVPDDNTPAAGLVARGMVLPVMGRSRSLAIFNPANIDTSVEVASLLHPRERVELRLTSHEITTLDLDLLFGVDYSGSYQVFSTSPVDVVAASDQGAVPLVAPSPRWFVPAANSPLRLSNPSSAPVTLELLAFGPHGSLRRRGIVHLAALQRRWWTAPLGPGGLPPAVSLSASDPIQLAGPKTSWAVTQPRSTWYAVHPGSRKLVVFNTSVGKTRVIAELFGASSPKSRRFVLGTHQSALVATGPATAVVLRASRDVVAGYAGISQGPLSSQPVTSTSLTAAGAMTSLSLFNPSNRPAHVAFELTRGLQTGSRQATISPFGVYVMRARQTSWSARGIVMSSDIPVVAVPDN